MSNSTQNTETASEAQLAEQLATFGVSGQLLTEMHAMSKERKVEADTTSATPTSHRFIV